MVTGEIVGVNFFGEYEACNGKVNTIDDFQKCNKCDMMLKRIKCKILKTARTSVTDQKGKVYVLMLFNDVLASIIGEEVRNVRCALLSTDTLNFNIDKGDVVYSIQHS